MTSGPIRIVVVEDFRLLRDGMTALLRARGLEVVGSCDDREGAIREVRRTQPGIVLIDSASGHRTAPRIVEAVRQAAPETRTVIMDVDPRDDDIVDFVRAGATGLVLKDATAEILIATIRSVAAGFCVVPPQLTDPLFAAIATRGATRRGGADKQLKVTPRESEVCRLIADGYSNKEIAVRLHIAVHTVKSHVHSILEKLGARTRAQIAARAAGDEQRPVRRAGSRSNGLAPSTDSHA